ncbi:MAG: hypothetical protein IPM82_22040 [Saprospiraceae bacterium]|nr:hypothetical protein [Saprospiraceae bacterium]
MPRPSYSLPNSFKKTARRIAVLGLASLQKFEGDTPNAAIFAARQNLVLLYSPPMTMTCATLPVASNRGSQRPIGNRPQIHLQKSSPQIKLMGMISPMMLACGGHQSSCPRPSAGVRPLAMIFPFDNHRAAENVGVPRSFYPDNRDTAGVKDEAHPARWSHR